ncbi:MAG: hypothetical protein JO295_12615 [Verrucomicrobia bacterium]|nr:hypothetical protein [Verrucomicrobiota bacterium]
MQRASTFYFVAAAVIAAVAVFCLWPRPTPDAADRLVVHSDPVPTPAAPSAPLVATSATTPDVVVETASPAALATPTALAEPPLNAPPALPPPAPRFATANPAQQQAGANDPALLAVRGSLRDYRAALGQNPVGTNAEITKALLGNNPRGAQFLGADAKVNDQGELLDRWEHPYYFHQISGTDMEVRSAGPDGVMWTPDDLVAR